MRTQKQNMSVPIPIPEEFSKVIRDFVRDIRLTFPEVNPLICKWWADPIVEFDYIDSEEDRKKAIEEYENSCVAYLFQYCQKKFPQRFFEILYQNEDMFHADSTVDTEFLPHIHFKNLWQFEVSQKTRDTIWKYLQLILFSIVGTLENEEAFGDTAKLFEAINGDEFKTKLQETLSQMEGLFQSQSEGGQHDGQEGQETNDGHNPLPNANDIHEHINGMLDGKLGKLAKEIAEETAQDLNMDMEDSASMKDVFSKLIQNPTKLMGLVKTVGEKLDTKIKSGEIKESELIAEATEMMQKMKNMPGMGNIQSMLGKMGIPGMGGAGAKMNMGAMEAQLNRNMKAAKMKERMRSKVGQGKSAAKMTPISPATPQISEEEIISIFSTGEKVERTPRKGKDVKETQTQVPEAKTTSTTNLKKKKKH